MCILEERSFVGQHLLVFRTSEQLEMIEHVFGILGHCGVLFGFEFDRLARLAYSAAIRLGRGASFHGALVFFQIGELIAMSMSRAKIANPS